jgi:hypothetical protein
MPIVFPAELPELVHLNEQIGGAKKTCAALTNEEFSEQLTALVTALLAEGRFADAALVDRAAGLVRVF